MMGYSLDFGIERNTPKVANPGPRGRSTIHHNTISTGITMLPCFAMAGAVGKCERGLIVPGDERANLGHQVQRDSRLRIGNDEGNDCLR